MPNTDTFENAPVPDTATAAPAPEVETTVVVETPAAFDIDQQLPLDQLPSTNQFDETGKINVTAEAPATRITDALQEPQIQVLKLSETDRKNLAKTHPRIYEALMRAEEEANLIPRGMAMYAKSALREGSSRFSENSLPLNLACTGLAALRSVAERLLTMDLTEPHNQTWLACVHDSLDNAPNEDFMLAALVREGSDWRQTIETKPGRGETQHVHNKVYSYDKKDGPIHLTGPQAISYAAAVTGGGRPSSSPMPSSGWSASYRSGSNTEWARYYELLIERRNELGRSTAGVGFSVSRSMYVEQALLFALDHVQNVSFKTGSDMADRTGILRNLKFTDIDQFLTGFLVANHPDGFPIRYPCNNAGVCNHVMELDANLRTMVVFDNSVFTEDQVHHLLRDSQGTHSMESIITYQNQLRTNQPKVVKIKSSNIIKADISIEFEVCSALDYIESSKRWIERVKLAMQGMINENTSATRRAEIQSRFYWTAPLREYAHLVKSIRIGEAIIKENPDNKENPRYDIEEYLVQASEDGVMRENFRKEAIRYMNESTCSVVAVPAHRCPVCDHLSVSAPSPEDANGNRFLDCTPVDVATVFFNLALRRVMELSR